MHAVHGLVDGVLAQALVTLQAVEFNFQIILYRGILQMRQIATRQLL